MSLETFISDSLARPFAWGTTDCSLVVADWVVANGHPDPAAHLRGTYDSEEGCRAVIATAGGLVPLFSDCAARAGLLAVTAPTPGAVGVIGASRRRDRQWGAIFNGSKWLVRWDDQFAPFSAHPLCMWGV